MKTVCCSLLFHCLLSLISEFLNPRDNPNWRRDCKQLESPDQQQQQHHQNQGPWAHRRTDSSASTFAPFSGSLSLRGRAMSENDLRFDSSSRWSSTVCVAASQTLSEVEEGSGDERGRDAVRAAKSNRKKTPPPPRPPPPNWEQFHRRRASHHTLFSSFTPQPPHTQSSSHMAPLESARQRSYSSPPERQALSESCPRCICNLSQSQDQRPTLPTANQNYAKQQPQQPDLPYGDTPPSPMLSRRAFRPVALPQKESNVSSWDTEQQLQQTLHPLPTTSLPPPMNNSR